MFNCPSFFGSYEEDEAGIKQGSSKRGGGLCGLCPSINGDDINIHLVGG